MVIFADKKSDKDINPKLIPEVNIGLVGHVDHGKSTLTQSLTGKWPDTHSEEMKRGITIRLGYADVTFYKCDECGSPEGYGTTEKCPICFGEREPTRTVSLVDAPGHKTLMATVLSATSIMDGALIIIAADEDCPRPQTEEHLKALDIVGIDNIVVVQNKIDKVTEEEAKENYNQIKDFIEGTCAEDAPIIPVSASQRVNIDALIEAIEKNIPTPERDVEADPRMLVARSFDVNRPGTDIDKLKGGVIGGSLTRGKFEVGDEIIIKPGRKANGMYEPIKTEITGLQKVNKDLDEAGAGGLLAVRTKLDPSMTKSDSLGGSIVGYPDDLSELTDEVTLDVNLLEYMVGVQENERKVDKIKTGEPLMMTIGTTKTAGSVTSARPKEDKQEIEVRLKLPICADKESRIAISRRVKERWRLIGWGTLK